MDKFIEVRNKYGIKTGEEELNFYNACSFVQEVFNAGWTNSYYFRDRAVELGFAKKSIKGTKKPVWVISIKNIFEMMHLSVALYKTTPVYKKRNIHEQKEN